MPFWVKARKSFQGRNSTKDGKGAPWDSFPPRVRGKRRGLAS